MYPIRPRKALVAALCAFSALLVPAADADAQQHSKLVGFLASNSPEGHQDLLLAFRQGLQAQGFVVGKNVAIEFRWAAGHYEQLPELARQLVHMPVDVIVAMAGPKPAIAAKSATGTIPIVFQEGGVDPVAAGLVSSFAHPGGNITGVHSETRAFNPKRLAYLHEAVPDAKVIGVLVNPGFVGAARSMWGLQEAAGKLGLRLYMAKASSITELDHAFADMKTAGAGAMLEAPDPYFFSHHKEVAAMAARYKLPAIYEWPDFVAAGGLMSYGDSLSGLYRVAGNYAGRILNGARPGDLPVYEASAVRLVINVRTANQLGVKFPRSILARADEVIQ